MQKIPTFFSNSPDNTHCLQAAVKTIISTFDPANQLAQSENWQALETLTAKRDGLWTWPTKTVINMKKMGYDVVFMADFDYKKFAKNGESYLIERYGEEVGKAQVEHSDLYQEKKLAIELLEQGIPPLKPPLLKDIKKLLSKDYLVICNVNQMPLLDREGYSGHFIVIYDFVDGSFIAHDPGLPARESVNIPIEVFVRAWEYPNERSRNLQAYKKKFLHSPTVPSVKYQTSCF